MPAASTPISRRALIAATAATALLTACGQADPPSPTSAPPTVKSVVIPLVGTNQPLRNGPAALLEITISGGRPGDTRFRLRPRDLAGRALTGLSTPTLAVRQLTSGSEIPTTLTASDDGSWLTDTLDGNDDWWQLTPQLTLADASLTGEAFFLLPDPNLAGFDAPAHPETDPAAAAALEETLAAMAAWQSIRWWQWLSGGNGSMIVNQFSVTTPAANGEPGAFEAQSLFAGLFDDTTPSIPPRVNDHLSVTIGDQAMERDAAGAVSPAAPTAYQPITQYPENYAGADSIRAGAETTVNGERCDVITFHCPASTTQGEAWYAFFRSQPSGELIQVAMLAANHYMICQYFDRNVPFVLRFPQGDASPAASPVSVS